MNRDEVLKKEKFDLKVKRSGTLQFQEFKIIRVPSPNGAYALLETEKFIDLSELVRLAEELQLPIKAKNGTVFPRGKTTSDFVGL